ncbi:hypothetical protein ACQEVZ_60630 [Dactylosporangium sp. CA-152071]|uniref:hypothetical protein n=1 Tax=Dactylosporangium sp. CA-152071 TaxID=3239933 RepID=UPI003D91515A
MSKRGAAAAIGRGAATTVQGNPWPYAVPAIGAVVNLVMSGVLSMLWGAYSGHPTVWQTAWRSALIMGASLAIITVTWAAGRARRDKVLRAMSMLMSCASCTGLFVLTFHGWTVDLVMVYVIVMAVACIGLAIVRLLRGDGNDAGKGHPFGEVAERVNELKAVGSLGPAKVIDGTVTTRVRMEPGVEFAELQKVQGSIATLVPTSKNNVRMIPDPERPGEGDLEITAHDHISKPPAWPGLTAPGKSIAEPVHLAVYGNGRPLPFFLFGDSKLHRNAIGLLVIAGQPGAGKTELILSLAAEVISRNDADLTVIDARKGEQLPDWLVRGARVITDMDTAESFIARLVDRVASRAGELGRRGFKQWTKGCGINAEVVLLDEAAKLVASRNEEEMVELAESVRSVGILLVLVQQRVTVDRLPSSVKKARGGSICMGVADDKEAARILSETTMNAGASPGSLGNRKPGCLFAELPGIPEEDWSRMARTYLPPAPEQLAAAVAPFVITAAPAAPASPAPRPPARPAGPRRTSVDLLGEEGEVLDDEPDVDEKGDPDELDLRDDDPECRPEQADPEIQEGGDPRAPIQMPKHGPRIAFSVTSPSERWTKAQLMELIRDTLLDAFEQGKTRFKPADLGPLVEHVGPDNLKPPRLSGYLGELCQPGPDRLLRRDRDNGWYVIDPPESDRALVGAGANT